MHSRRKCSCSIRNDPEMQEAYNQARVTFRYFWREIAWKWRRIVPALHLACVKAPFSGSESVEDHSEVEQMWLGSIDFDGQCREWRVQFRRTARESPPRPRPADTTRHRAG